MPPRLLVGLQRRGAVEFDIAINDFGNFDDVDAVSDRDTTAHRGPNDASATANDARDRSTAAGDDTCDGSAPA